MYVTPIGMETYSLMPVRVVSGTNSEEKRVFQENENSEKTRKYEIPGDKVTISEEAKKALQDDQESKERINSTVPGQNLDSAEKREVEELKRRDAQVRRHEMAHKMAGGTITGQIVYEYEQGPDGKRYATGGHISIDTSEESTPEATLRKAAAIRRAALAPADPSPADRRVAQKAQAMAAEARQEIAKEHQEAMAEQMAEVTTRLASGDAGTINVDLEKIFGAKLKNVEDIESPVSIDKISKTQDSIVAAYKANSSQNETQIESSSSSIVQDIKVGTSVPSKDRLSQTEEEIQREVVPEVSPVE